MSKRTQTKGRPPRRRAKKATSARAGNQRRMPRAAPGGAAAARTDASPRTRGGEKIPPGTFSRLPKWARTTARWSLRLGVAGGLSYGALLGVQEAYDYATTSPRFEARALLFEPTPHVSDADLRALMGITPGTNILSLEVSGLAAAVSEHPWVRRASVTRELPDTLIVEVEEHSPRAVLLAGDFFLVGEDGIPFKPLEPGERGTLPIVTGVEPSLVFTEPERAQKVVSQALAILEAYSTKQRPRLSEVNIDETGAATLYTADLGSQLRLGRTNVEAALTRYDALRAALGEESDKLAVAHLDANSALDGKDRIVASFFPAKDAPGFIEDATEQAQQRALEHRLQLDAAKNAKRNKKKGRNGARGDKSRLPRYE
ncbi:MAG: FtsQ-type POTRA domain-containing protein [Nannocystaceae bacterium]|nr:FtsQ-type POTRA domain-containing protein [Nannocystaceae bacterium]